MLVLDDSLGVLNLNAHMSTHWVPGVLMILMVWPWRKLLAVLWPAMMWRGGVEKRDCGFRLL
jgi:hypothetical protein